MKKKPKEKNQRAGERDKFYSPVVREITCDGFKSPSESKYSKLEGYPSILSFFKRKYSSAFRKTL